MYDHYISLGVNCEAAFNFRRILGKDIAYYFNWLVTPLSSLHQILENDFKNDFLKENLYYKGNQISMVTDRAYDISHHSPFKNIGGDLSGEEFDVLYKSQVEKLDLFKKRFFTLTNSKLKVLYFIKTSEDNAKEKSIGIKNLIQNKFPNHNFDIVVLQESHKSEAQWNENNIFNRYLARFSPYNNVPDTDSDSWDLIFKEFPLNPGAMQKAIV